jgi:hypothetical protein
MADEGQAGLLYPRMVDHPQQPERASYQADVEAESRIVE